MVFGGLFKCSVGVNAVGFEVDDFGADNGAVFVPVNDYAVKDAVNKLIFFDMTEGTLSPDSGLTGRSGEQGANVGLGKAVLQCLFDCFIRMLWPFRKPFNLFEGIVYQSAKVGGGLFEFKASGD